MISAQQARLGGQDVFDVSPISFAGDTLQLRGRKINRQLAEREGGADGEVVPQQRVGVLR